MESKLNEIPPDHQLSCGHHVSLVVCDQELSIMWCAMCKVGADLALALESLEAYSRLDDFHANCSWCDGVIPPEDCPECFPLADDARLKMRAVLAGAKGGAR